MAGCMKAPWRVELDCRFEEHTADIADNQILAWTLRGILQSGLCSGRILASVRQAFRGLQGAATLTPYGSSACLKRLYHRLNADYEPLHALCRFFLECSGPTHTTGTHDMLPFLVDMAHLFELFVAEWLKQHLPERFELLVQHSVLVGKSNKLTFRIDLVLCERQTGKVICVLDTKYKLGDSVVNADVSQVVTYAELQGCNKGVLLYPSIPLHRLDELVGNKRIVSLGFDLYGDDLDSAGSRLVKELEKLA